MDLAAGAAVVGCVLTAAWGLFLPVEVPADGRPASGRPAAPRVAPRSASDARPADRSVKLVDLQRVCAIDLRSPLYEDRQTDTSPAETAVRPPRSPMAARLVGTVSEAGHSVALFQMPDGSIALCGVDQTIDDRGGPVMVTAIEPYRVTVQYAGGTQVLTLTPPEGVEP